MMEFHVNNFRRAAGITPTGNEVIAIFDVDIAPFKMHSCGIARGKDGTLYAAIPGRQAAKISIRDADLREQIKAEALRQFEELPND